MDITIGSTEEKPLMHRTDYVVRVAAKGVTPSREQLVGALAKKLDASADTTVVRQVTPQFGEAASSVHVSVYKNKDALAQYEPAYMAKRHEKKAAEAAPEEKPAENSEGKAEEAAEVTENTEEKSDEPAEKKEEAPAEKQDTPEEKKDESTDTSEAPAEEKKEGDA